MDANQIPWSKPVNHRSNIGLKILRTPMSKYFNVDSHSTTRGATLVYIVRTNSKNTSHISIPRSFSAFNYRRVRL